MAAQTQSNDHFQRTAWNKLKLTQLFARLRNTCDENQFFQYDPETK